MNKGTRPSVIRRIWDNFMKTTFGAGTRKVVGRDHYGNVYYVFEGDTAKATKRGYLPGSTSQWEQMPVEWEAWLRGRRRFPPSQEEIDKNASVTETARLRGQELERQREIERRQQAEREEIEASPEKPPPKLEEGQAHDSTLRKTPLPGIKSGTFQGMPGEKTKEYPVHKEYEQYPGEEPKKWNT